VALALHLGVAVHRREALGATERVAQRESHASWIAIGIGWNHLPSPASKLGVGPGARVAPHALELRSGPVGAVHICVIQSSAPCINEGVDVLARARVRALHQRRGDAAHREERRAHARQWRMQVDRHRRGCRSAPTACPTRPARARGPSGSVAPFRPSGPYPVIEQVTRRGLAARSAGRA